MWPGVVAFLSIPYLASKSSRTHLSLKCRIFPRFISRKSFLLRYALSMVPFPDGEVTTCNSFLLLFTSTHPQWDNPSFLSLSIVVHRTTQFSNTSIIRLMVTSGLSLALSRRKCSEIRHSLPLAMNGSRSHRVASPQQWLMVGPHRDTSRNNRFCTAPTVCNDSAIALLQLRYFHGWTGQRSPSIVSNPL